MVKSAERVLKLLELLAVIPDAVGVSEVARHLDIPKSSAQALLETLVKLGYVERTGKAYRLAEPLRQGTWVGGDFARLKRAAQPIMQQVVERTQESAFIGVLLPEWRIRYIDKVVSPNEVRYDGDLGHDRPAYCTSIGHLFLAEASEEELAAYFEQVPLRKITPATETDPDRLRAILREVKRQGYAESRDGHVAGASGVAAPIFGASGRLIAGITLGAPTWRFDQVREALILATEWAAAEITNALRSLPDRRQESSPPNEVSAAAG